MTAAEGVNEDRVAFHQVAVAVFREHHDGTEGGIDGVQAWAGPGAITVAAAVTISYAIV